MILSPPFPRRPDQGIDRHTRRRIRPPCWHWPYAVHTVYAAVLLALHGPSYAQLLPAPLANRAATLRPPAPSATNTQQAPDPATEPTLTAAERVLTLDADQAAYATEIAVQAQGKAHLRDRQTGRWPLDLQADTLDYELFSDRAKAQGHVRLEHEGNIYTAERGQMRLTARQGLFEGASYSLQKTPLPPPANRSPQHLAEPISPPPTGAHGEAKRIEILDPNRFIAADASYSMCRRAHGPAWLQDWFLSSKRLEVDTVDNVAYATSPRLYFKGVPIFAAPYMRLPLNSQRVSGWLPPTFSTDSRDGFSIGADYYWDIAPNRDATFSPIVKTQRGLDMGAEFRYLEESYSGTLRGNLLPSDRLRKRTRWGWQWQHSQQLPLGLPWTLADSATLHWQLQAVSDPNYWKDFASVAPNDAAAATISATPAQTFSVAQIRNPRRGMTSGLSERLLESHVKVDWNTDRFTLGVSAFRYQALNDLNDRANDFVEPSWKLPQIRATYKFDQPLDAAGAYRLVGDAALDFTRFHQHLASGVRKIDQRTVAQMQLGVPMEGQPAWLRPKVALQGRRYLAHAPFAATTGGKASVVGQQQDYVLVPTVSLDAGLVFERTGTLGNTSYRQTLEPRIFYSYTPRVAQNHLPNNDSARKDLSFNSLFEENAFSGLDRVSDTHAVTLAVDSYFLQADSGQQLARLRAAQRFHLAPETVLLPGEQASTNKRSDILLGADVRWHPYWNASATAQLDPKTKRSQRYSVGIHFLPSPYRVLSVAYRYQRNATATALPLKQIDIGWQWPIHDFWNRSAAQDSADAQPQRSGWGRLYTVGRLNFDRATRKLNNAILGLEYDANCWVGRFVVERLNLGSAHPSTRYMFQLELVDFSRISFGNNPLNTLREYVPGYTSPH